MPRSRCRPFDRFLLHDRIANVWGDRERRPNWALEGVDGLPLIGWSMAYVIATIRE